MNFFLDALTIEIDFPFEELNLQHLIKVGVMQLQEEIESHWQNQTVDAIITHYRIMQLKSHQTTLFLSFYTYFSSSTTHTSALIHIVIPLLHTIFPPTLLYTLFPLDTPTTPLVFIHHSPIYLLTLVFIYYSPWIFTNLNIRVFFILVGCLFLQQYGNHA